VGPPLATISTFPLCRWLPRE